MAQWASPLGMGQGSVELSRAYALPGDARKPVDVKGPNSPGPKSHSRLVSPTPTGLWDKLYYPYIPLLRELAMEDLNRALLEFLTRETIAPVSNGELVHPASYEMLNSLVAASMAAGREPDC